MSAKTKEKIRDLIPAGALPHDTLVTIINALYFKGRYLFCCINISLGSWAADFPKEATMETKFHLLDGSQKKVWMMYKESKFHSTVLADLDSVAVKLPFQQSK